MKTIKILLTILVLCLLTTNSWGFVEAPEDLWKCVIAEAIGEDYVGMEAVTWVFRNRLEKGMNIGSCACKRVDLEDFISEHSNYKTKVKEIVNRVFNSSISKDITKGAIYFDNFEAFGVPSFARNERGEFDEERFEITVIIKNHVFFKEKER